MEYYECNEEFKRLYPDVLILLLEKLKGKDLINFCNTNRELRSICNDDYFWKNRSIRDYSMGPLIDYKIGSRLIPSYKQYYIDRANMRWRPIPIHFYIGSTPIQNNEVWLNPRACLEDFNQQILHYSSDKRFFYDLVILGTLNPTDLEFIKTHGDIASTDSILSRELITIDNIDSGKIYNEDNFDSRGFTDVLKRFFYNITRFSIIITHVVVTCNMAQARDLNMDFDGEETVNITIPEEDIGEILNIS